MNGRNTLKDCLFLSVVVILSLILYVHRLGFYSDDIAFLGNYVLSPDQTLIGQVKTFLFPPEHGSSTLMRPVQAIYISALYWLFGLNPFGYHLVNAFVLLGVVLVFYLILKKINLPRIIAVPLPLVYVLLPHYSTDRFWYAAFQANLSMLFYFVSLYAGLRALLARHVGWHILSYLMLILSTLAYEVVLPMYTLNLVLFLNPGEKIYRYDKDHKVSQRNKIFFIVGTIIVLGIVVVFKALTTSRLSNGPLEDLSYRYLIYVGYIVKSALWVNYKVLLFQLPQIIATIISRYFNLPIFVIGSLTGLIIFYYLYSLLADVKSKLPTARSFIQFLAVSLGLFILGYAIFFTNNNIGFSAVGIGNRVAIAAAIGVALTVIAGTGIVCKLLFPEWLAKLLFSIVIACFCAINVIIINTLAVFWIQSYPQQQSAVADIYKSMPSVATGSTILLDGVCPFIGPAPVFESSWDLTGALKIVYHDQTVQADIVKPTIKVEEDGIHTFIYNQEAIYPYQKLFVYDDKSKIIYPMTTSEIARNYFQKQSSNYRRDCPESRDGYGVEIF